MAILGKKFGTKIRRLGAKVDDKVHMLGNKTNNVLDKIEKTNNEIITKSGKALNVANKIVSTGDKVLGVLNDAGLKDVPVIGGVSVIAQKGLEGAHKGLNKAEKMRNSYIDKTQKGLNAGRNVAGNLEKHNTRKALADMARENLDESFQ
jgi:hypothetical protein